MARSTSASEKAKSTARSGHFCKLRCGKCARRCRAKHMSKSKCAKHLSLGPLLKVEMWKMCTPLRREAHVSVKSVRADGLGQLVDIQMLFRVAAQRIVHLVKREQNVSVLQQFQLQLRQHYTPLHYKRNYNYNYRYITLYYASKYITLHCTALRCTMLHYATLHYTTLHYTTLH